MSLLFFFLLNRRIKTAVNSILISKFKGFVLYDREREKKIIIFILIICRVTNLSVFNKNTKMLIVLLIIFISIYGLFYF